MNRYTRVRSFSAPFGFSLFVLASCAGGPMKLYPGEQRPKEELAIIDAGQNFAVTPAVFLWMVDGTRIGESWGDDRPVEVLPGRHSVRAGIGWEVLREPSLLPFMSRVFAQIMMNTAEEAMTFDAEAGHTYQVKASAPDYETASTDGISSWIVDVQTGKTVARTNPRPGSRAGMSIEEIIK